jgi:hypothetical protein
LFNALFDFFLMVSFFAFAGSIALKPEEPLRAGDHVGARAGGAGHVRPNAADGWSGLKPESESLV